MEQNKMNGTIKDHVDNNMKRLQNTLPPKETLFWMNMKTEEVNSINNGTLSKLDFKLGMMAMWSYIESGKENELEKELIGFQIFLNNQMLISNHDCGYEDVAKKYIQSLKK